MLLGWSSLKQRVIVGAGRTAGGLLVTDDMALATVLMPDMKKPRWKVVVMTDANGPEGKGNLQFV